jgi:hypothetical protein
VSVENKATALAKYIGTLSDFQIVNPEYPYDHMGATITDAMLQAGINYNTVVKPRVDQVYALPEAKTTSGFLKLLERTNPQLLLKWKGEKPNRILRVTKLFVKENIEAEEQLKLWLKEEENLQKLGNIKGVGGKTLDYFKMLSGIHTSAIDRHLRSFLHRAGVQVDSYLEAQEVINKAANKLKIKESVLDHSIWKYMSDRKGTNTCGCH